MTKKTDEERGDYVAEAMALLKGEKQDVEFYSSGFTPTPDKLVESFGVLCATVWGKVWRYCQMEEDICRAAQERLADELNVSRNTLNKYLTILEDNGYIKDRTPDLRNKPHIYTDTGKIRLKIGFWMTESTAQNLSSETSNFEHEESTTNLYSVYEANMGPLTPMVADSLDDMEKTYSVSWVIDSFELAVKHNKRSLAYCAAILKRWSEQGKDEGGKPKETFEEAAAKAGYR